LCETQAMKHTNAPCEGNAKFLSLTAVVHIVTAGF
jgi:hypothetical protein